MKFRTLPALICLTALSMGCSHGVQIAEHAMDYNRSVEQAENEMFLLNIIRAAKRHPMHFTRIGGVNGSLKSSVSVGPDLPLGSDGRESYGDGLSLSTSSSPSFSVAVLDDKPFFDGILSPVEVSTMQLFLNQGWRKDTVMQVFVERLEAEAVGRDVSCTVHNNPERAKDFAAFNELKGFFPDQLEFTLRNTETKFGPPLTRKELASADHLSLMAEEELTVKHLGGGRYQLMQTTRKARLKPAELRLNRRVFEDYVAKNDPCTQEAFAALKSAAQDGGDVVTFRATPHLRSAQAMLYFLGELSRVDLTMGRDVGQDDVKDANRYWTVVEGPLADPAVQVVHKGRVYSIPDAADLPDHDRTMQMLTLARQVFSMNVTRPEGVGAPVSFRLVTE